MIVTHEESEQWWKSDELRELVRLSARDPRSALHNEAKLLTKEEQLKDQDLWPFEVRRALILVLAEYGRRKHPERAVAVATDPNKFGIQSPRSDLLIPERLWKTLGDVCRAHGGTFDDVMRLVQEANGVATGDKVHPRFAAAMLRLGDLLDLDNGRFCPTMLKVFGAIPERSMAHVEKHASIEHFLVNPGSVQVLAKCESISGYQAINHWLTMLRTELDSLRAQWNNIAPHPNFGAPPSSGPPLEAALTKDFVFSQPGRPDFTIESGRVLEMLRDSGVYKSPETDFLRELIQNSHDAIIARAHEEWESMPSPSPTFLQELRDRIKGCGWGIRVEIQRIRADEIRHSWSVNPSTSETLWEVSVSDDGIGISRDEIRSLQNVGSGGKAKTTTTHEWVRETGEFGIGIQSAFFISDEIQIRSHDLRTRLGSHIRLHRHDGLIAWKDTPDSPYKYGTVVSIRFPVPETPNRIGQYGPKTKLFMENFDIVTHSEIPYFPAKLVDAALSHSAQTIIPVEVRLDGEAVNREETKLPKIRSSGVALRQVQFTPGKVTGRSEFMYRGSSLEKSRLILPAWSHWVIASYDLYFGRSSELLTLSRDEFRSGEHLEFDIPIRCSLAMAEYIMDYEAPSEEDSCVGARCAAAYLMLGAADEWGEEEDLSDHIKACIAKLKEVAQAVLSGNEGWRSMLRIGGGGEQEIMLSELDEGGWLWQQSRGRGEIPRWRVSTSKPTQSDDGSLLIKSRINEIAGLFGGAQVCVVPNVGTVYRVHKDPFEHGVDDDEFWGAIVSVTHARSHIGFRMAIPLPPKYRALALVPMRTWARSPFALGLSGAWGVLPLRIDIPGPDRVARILIGKMPSLVRVSCPNVAEYIRWVYTNRRNQNDSEEQITQCLVRLLKDAIEYFEAQSGETKFELEFNPDQVLEKVESTLARS